MHNTKVAFIGRHLFHLLLIETIFQYQFVNVKALMKRVPKGMQWLNEWDVPFPLPSDPGEFREYRESHREERAVLNDFAVAFDR